MSARSGLARVHSCSDDLIVLQVELIDGARVLWDMSKKRILATTNETANSERWENIAASMFDAAIAVMKGERRGYLMAECVEGGSPCAVRKPDDSITVVDIYHEDPNLNPICGYQIDVPQPRYLLILEACSRLLRQIAVEGPVPPPQLM